MSRYRHAWPTHGCLTLLRTMVDPKSRRCRSRRPRRVEGGRRSARLAATRPERWTRKRHLASFANARAGSPRVIPPPGLHGDFRNSFSQRLRFSQPLLIDVPDRDVQRLRRAIVGLLAVEDPRALARRAVEIARDSIGLVRVSIYLAEQFDDLLSGTFASDSRGAIVDEQNVLYAVGKTDHKSLSPDRGGSDYTVFNDCLIVEHRRNGRRIAALGWVACTPIRCGDDVVGVVFNDAGPSQAPCDEAKQTKLAMLCFVIGAAIGSAKAARTATASETDRMAIHALVMQAVGLLARDPGVGGFAVARELETSPRRLTRAFETQLGVSLLDYRNRMRLHHVAVTVSLRPDRK